MREKVRSAVRQAVAELSVESGEMPPFVVEEPPEDKYGHFSTNAAMLLARPLKSAPRKIAEKIAALLEKQDFIQTVSVAGPGFINLFIKPEKWFEDFRGIPDDGSEYGGGEKKTGEKLLVEFVSANPTGPLHIGHGRGAAVGDTLARILSKAGYDVTTEYYVNDAGLQMENLGRSTLARYRELLGADSEFPDGGYHGEYIRDIARLIVDREGGRFLEMPDEEAVPFFTKEAADFILEGIKTDLERFRVKFDVWTSEKSFHDANMVECTVDRLRSSGAVFEEDGALWLNTIEAGDEKNRVVRRANGIFTYFAADIAYHEDKYRRGFTRLMDIWGADHHGYVARMKAAVKALGRDPDSLKPLLIQLVSLKRHGKVIAMSTRGGTFTALKEVLDEVGEDAARFFFLTRSYDSHLDFDLDLAKEQSSENPVYYVQYAHARVSNIFVTARERGITEVPPREVDWSALEPAEEQRIIRKCLAFPGLVKDCAETLSPHHLTHYLVELAGMFHKYYYAHRVVTDDARLTSSRLALAARVRTVLGNGLDLLGVTAPDRM